MLIKLMELAMKVGMLWLDDDKRRSLEEKIRRAADYFEMKYGHSPNWCYVNNKTLAEEKAIGRMWVEPAAYVLPHHFWLGIHGTESFNKAIST